MIWENVPSKIEIRGRKRDGPASVLWSLLLNKRFGLLSSVYGKDFRLLWFWKLNFELDKSENEMSVSQCKKLNSVFFHFRKLTIQNLGFNWPDSPDVSAELWWLIIPYLEQCSTIEGRIISEDELIGTSFGSRRIRNVEIQLWLGKD